jgi:hypothetical protein
MPAPAPTTTGGSSPGRTTRPWRGNGAGVAAGDSAGADRTAQRPDGHEVPVPDPWAGDRLVTVRAGSCTVPEFAGRHSLLPLPPRSSPTETGCHFVQHEDSAPRRRRWMRFGSCRPWGRCCEGDTAITRSWRATTGC